MDNDLVIRIRKARGKFAAMAITYFLGVFNDNFFKISVMMLAAGSPAKKGMINALFAIPFILFAAYAGWMADRFSKRNVVISAKVLEVAAMLCGAVGIILGSWPLMMIMVLLMATQSTIFGPSLNGTIPELYPREYVPTANGIIKVLVTGAILLGTITSGYALSAEDVWAMVYYVNYLATEQRSDTIVGEVIPFGKRHPDGVLSLVSPEESDSDDASESEGAQ